MFYRIKKSMQSISEKKWDKSQDPHPIPNKVIISIIL